MGNRNTRRQKRRRQRRKTATWTLVPRQMKKGEKLMLADYIKALPTTPDLAKAKTFCKTGAYKFLARHPGLEKKLRPIQITAAA